MTYLEIVKKLIGPINPIGETNIDNQRFENLKEMAELVNKLVSEIDAVAYMNKDAKEFSVRRAADYSSEFLKETLGII